MTSLDHDNSSQLLANEENLTNNAATPQVADSQQPVAEETVTEPDLPEQPVADVAQGEPQEHPEPIESAAAQEPIAQEQAAPELPEQPEACNYDSLSKQELLDALKELAQKSVDVIKDEVAHIKSAFFAIRKAEVAQEKDAFIQAGNKEEDFVPAEDAIENDLKEILNCIKDKRAELNAELEALKAQNADKKRAIIAEINAISADPDNINRQFNRVKELQQNFKEIGEVSASESTRLWKDYQLAVERFYDLLKMNKELRDYDFKKNLEIKQQLCAQAEALDDEEDVIAAFKKLQELHNTWRETGPVAPELREELWVRFKNASSVINKKHQAYFENRKEQEQENADAKQALCEKIEAISTENLKSYAAWDETTKQIIALQDEWKKLGFAARKVNNELFARFRKACDDFFEKKAAFFKEMKDELSANLAKKNELVARAEALKDSTDWKKTTDAFVALQKEWKTVGPVVKKHSEAVWKRFVAACDYFFEQKKSQTTSVRAVEHDNLKAKKEIITSLNATLDMDDAEQAAETARQLIAKWSEIGHVPFKEKDKIYAEFKQARDAATDKFGLRASRQGSQRFAGAAGVGDSGDRERERLVRSYEQKCSELKVIENNLGFLSARSKAGNAIVLEMEKKIAKIKEDIAALEQRIKQIDEKE